MIFSCINLWTRNSVQVSPQIRFPDHSNFPKIYLFSVHEQISHQFHIILLFGFERVGGEIGGWESMFLKQFFYYYLNMSIFSVYWKSFGDEDSVTLSSLFFFLSRNFSWIFISYARLLTSSIVWRLFIIHIALAKHLEYDTLWSS